MRLKSIYSSRPQALLVLLWLAAASSPAFATVTGVTVCAPAVQGNNCPSSVTLTHGQSAQLTATVQGAPPFSPAVLWSFGQGSPALGTISSSGLYTAPASIFQNFTITIAATSITDPTKVGTVTIFLEPNIAVSISPTSVTLMEGQQQQFTATVTGTLNQGVSWTIQPPGAGSIDVQTGVYTAPATISGRQTVMVTATSAADPNQKATATVTLTPAAAPPGITLTPATANLKPGQSQQFTATVTGLANTLVSWSLGCGQQSPTCQTGTISGTGLYTAPASFAVTQTVILTATTLDPANLSASSTITLTPLPMTVVPTGVMLNPGQTQQFSALVAGAPFPTVTWSSSPAGAGNIDPATGVFTAPPVISAKQTVTIFAVSTLDPTQVASTTLTLAPTPAAPGITVSPATAGLKPGEHQQFTATVTGLSSTLVIWSIDQPLGTISSTGLYTAPTNFTGNATITVTATSLTDPTFSGTAVVTLSPVPLVVTPASVTLSTNATAQFSASINGTPDTNVSWSLSANFGTISQTGLYTAPAEAPIRLVIQVIATDNADPTHTGQATVTINQSSATITPASVSLTNGQSQQFSFNIDGVPDANPAADIMWTLSPNVGSISPAGLYTAPPAVSAGQAITLTGLYLPDPTKTAKATINLAVFVDVGHGAPNSAIQQQFISNFYRNGFSNLVTLPPLNDVHRLGSTGYVQEFADVNKGSGKFALVKPNASTAAPSDPTIPTVFQMYPDVYTYYTSVGVNTAGYPTMDTQNCPAFDPNNSCTYDIFDKGYALFVYKAAVFAAQTQFTIRLGFFTKWSAAGGVNGLGRPVDAEISVTAPDKTTATVQTYSSGAIYTITSGPNNTKVYAVATPIYTMYQNQGGPTGYLGLPTADALVLSDGTQKQTFQGGAIQFKPGSDPGVLLPVASVQLSGVSNPLNLKLGQTALITATPQTSIGAAISGRTITWTTSNGQVATVAGNGSTGTITAVGAGSASIRASSEGVVSAPISVVVTSPCCQVGEGAPTIAIQQAFQNAVTRDHLSVVIPASSPVQRLGAGYLQQLQSAVPGSNVTYLLAKSDKLPTVYVVSGDILARYRQLGGVTGALGYPTSDATAGGTETFENGALAGSPVRLVSGIIFLKWSVLGSETGPAGPPMGDAAPFRTIGANAGSQQVFRNGVIYGATSGPKTGQAYFVSGLILDAYNGLGGPGGSFGMPLSDEFASGATRRQNFEGGYIDYNAGDAAAQAHPIAQKAAIVAPQSVLAGSRAHLAITGFQPGNTIRVSVTGQPDFFVTTSNGSYGWDIYVPLAAKAATVGIHAEDTNSTDTADASYNILSLAGNRAQFTITQGNLQTGLPGALAPQKLQAVLRDASGNPVVGAPVVFLTSAPDVLLAQASAATDQNGVAQAGLRLPPREGIAAVTLDAPGIASSPITFYATAVSSSMSGFPTFTQALDIPLGTGSAKISQKGALLTAAAAILRHLQNQGSLLTPNGPSDPGALNQFLKSFCATDAQGKKICDGFLVNPDSGEQVVNLWRAGEFTGGGVDVSVENPDLNTVRDLLALGSPVLLALNLTADNIPAGGHYVVAIGVAPDGGILIQDPSPGLARANLGDYLASFVAGVHVWQGSLVSAVRLAPRIPSPTRFLLAALSQPPAILQSLALEANSSAGSCGLAVDLPDAADVNAPPAGVAPQLVSRFVACDGSQPLYQINVGLSQPFHASITDFASGGTATDLSGNVPASYKASRPSLTLTIAPQDVTLLAGGVVNSATLTPGIAPGGLFTVFGSGLAGAGGDPVVSFDGSPATIVRASPFQITAQVPPDLDIGTHNLQIQDALGSASESVEIVSNAPAIFVLAAPAQGAVANEGGQLNSAVQAAIRGQSITISATGLGSVTKQGDSSVVMETVTAVLNGTELEVASAVADPSMIGQYLVVVPIPVSTPPGLDLPLSLRQAGVDSNVVNVSVQ